MPVYSKTDLRKAIDLERAVCTSLEMRDDTEHTAEIALGVSKHRLEVLQQLLAQIPDDELHDEPY
ncbi:MAG: hypothetical protein EOO77_16300 [Oxalobacteraceae bacterium]|nr:MAG: hypothetical protein EOO77_16300 [Oxalobacteraceae bacterium]